MGIPDADGENLAQTLAREMKQPTRIETHSEHVSRIATPEGWTIKDYDDEKYHATPRRKMGTVGLLDVDSFINYVKRHNIAKDTSIWCNADYFNGKVSFTAILNDHGASADAPAWRDHLAIFSPAFSTEWFRWKEKNKTSFTQAEFATFVEDNLKDIVKVGESPSGGQMLEMALDFEANQEKRFKSAIRLQSGTVNMQFVDSEDAQTISKMQMFERFTIGIPVFWGGDPYQVDARLRYRQRDGKLTFHYELIRLDKVLEAATKTMIAKVNDALKLPFFFGNPFAK